MIARRERRRDDDKLARGVGGRLGDGFAGVAQLDFRVRRRPAGDDRFARRIDVHDVERRLQARSARALSTGAGALAAGGAAGTAGGAGGTIGGFDSAGARATSGMSAGFCSRNSGWVQTTAPAPATTTARAAAPTQTSVRCDGMLAHSRPQHIAQREQLRQIPVAEPSFVVAEFVQDPGHDSAAGVSSGAISPPLAPERPAPCGVFVSA